VQRLILKPVRTSLEAIDTCATVAGNAGEMAKHRRQLSRVSSVLMTPMLKAFPNYRGPLRSTPPEAWMVKLLGPEKYLGYVPYWKQRLTGMLAAENEQSKKLAEVLSVAA
jgi:hypothetical protein